MLVMQRPTIEPVGEESGNRQRFAVECRSWGADKKVVRLQDRGAVERFAQS